MATAGGANIAVDGLVFGYDTGYPLVSGSSDAYKFNRGEPTTNILNNSIIGTGNGASLGSDDFGTYIQLADQTTSYSRFQLPSIPVSSNETYTWSFELYSEVTITQNGNYFFDTNEYSDQFPASNDLSRLSFSQERPNTLPAGVWTPFRLTVTMKDNLTGAYTYDFFNMYYPAFQNKKIYYRNMQFERNKDHKTPYVGQGGTRSVSGSLIDLTRTTDIDLSNVSFDSNAQLAFDGTDDYIDLGDDSRFDFDNGIMTVEAIVTFPSSWTAGSQYPNIVSKGASAGWDTDGWSLFGFRDWGGGKSWGLGIRNGATNRIVSRQNVAEDVYWHIVGTLDGTTMRLYENGVEVSTNTQTINPANNNTSVRIARDPNSNYFPGEIPVVKIYNRALTAAEIQQNYNALKERFSL